MGEFFVWSLFIGTVLFFFPVFLSTDVYLNVFENRAWFAFSLFGLKVFGGYAEVRKDGIALHLTEKYAILLAYERMGETKKYFEITDGFQLYRLHQTVETGGSESAYGVMIAALLQSAGGAAFAVLRTRHPFLSLKNGTVLSDRPCLKITLGTTTVFNGFVLTLAIVKKLLEAFLNWIKKRKSMVLWKRRHNVSPNS